VNVHKYPRDAWRVECCGFQLIAGKRGVLRVQRTERVGSESEETLENDVGSIEATNIRRPEVIELKLFLFLRLEHEFSLHSAVYYFVAVE
jgi:hypothetical protein